MLEAILRLNNIIAVLDIIIVAVVLYWLMLMFKGTRAERMLWGLSIVVIIYFVSLRAELLTLHWILSNFLGSVVIFIIVVFQQDIRRALVHMGKPFSSRDIMVSRELLEEVTTSAASMSKTKTGGLIVIERSVDIEEFLDAGVDIDGGVTKELILSVFNPASPMHDGAVVIRRGRLFKAGCILPLTKKELAESMGTRHRAAIGLAEEADAVIIVVSERTGEITLVLEEDVFAGLDPENLRANLKRIFYEEENPKKPFFSWKAGS